MTHTQITNDLVPFGAPRPTLLYTDASGSGHVSAVLFHAGGRYTPHTPAVVAYRPRGNSRIRDVRNHPWRYARICHRRHGPLLLRCDNQGTGGKIFRGACQSGLCRGLSSVFWPVAAANNTPTWIGYVASILNIADRPSRLRSGLLKPLTTPVVDHGVPAQFRAITSSSGALNAAKLTPPPIETDSPPPWECCQMDPSPQEYITLGFEYGRTGCQPQFSKGET